jgi:hypothetical protein
MTKDEILKKLKDIDDKSIRPMREKNVDKLHLLELEAEKLRNKLKSLDKKASE